MRVVYVGDAEVSDAQVRWGGNDDPRGVLQEGVEYQVAEEEVHSWHTKLHLTEVPGRKFNSVHFREV